MPIWASAVTAAIRRYVARTGSPEFTRKAFIAAEIEAIEAETRTSGLTPTQTLGRELQQLRDAGLIEFVVRGTYRWLGTMPEMEPVVPTNGVFQLVPHPGDDLSEFRYRFEGRWLPSVTRMIDQWVIHQRPERPYGGDYYAAARVERIDPELGSDGIFVAQIARGTFLEFGRAVPFELDGTIIERELLKADGRLDGDRAAQLVRALSSADFNRILEFGLVTEEDLLPRIDACEDMPPAHKVAEETDPWNGPIDRTTMLVNRKVRNRQFRKRVLDVYGARCALTGMKLLNGGGRAETEAAHIMSVDAGGPDAIDNGIALSGTIHWMFDRGLISLSDAGDILLSRKINDLESVERLIFPDRKARLPQVPAHRPHPRYLDWHRTACFRD
ncbi:HNH endonuclease [Sphingomonas sp. HF-S4]|uniref:HNH endonuclease n=1 Tax=Sphingomonas agrestis TaxID=3080540 RepID=A0ABU3Y5J7_9SPHN|nr:HNH endonuclease [Sphingomonas sp. HF-S4]MDV3456675.1 HNH endonuclease [Sphingomonas sp. HF-S4]